MNFSEASHFLNEFNQMKIDLQKVKIELKNLSDKLQETKKKCYRGLYTHILWIWNLKKDFKHMGEMHVC